MLGKTAQLWPGHVAFKPEFVLEWKEKTSSHLWDILLTRQVCLLPSVSSYHYPTTYSESESEEEEEGQGCPKGLSSQELPSCGFSGKCVLTRRKKWRSEVEGKNGEVRLTLVKCRGKM